MAEVAIRLLQPRLSLAAVEVAGHHGLSACMPLLTLARLNLIALGLGVPLGLRVLALLAALVDKAALRPLAATS